MTPITTLQLPFGRSHVSLEVRASNLIGVFGPHHVEQSEAESTLLRRALEHPIGTPHLRDIARSGQRVAIVTSDLTRPCPSQLLIPLILDELAAAGVRDDTVTVVAALGLHRRMTSSELEATVGAGVFRRLRVINHDAQDTIRLGTTSAGTPVEIFRPIVEADLRVCLGNLEFHYFVGYSGGAKAIIPGCASETTVRANHALMAHPGAVTANIESNPVRADLEEGAAKVGVDFILNVLVDEHRIVGAVAGDVVAAHRKGCEMVDQRGKVPIPELADIVVVSAGGYPKDVNLYQAQKALDHAAHAVRTGGVIILVAECPEGLGNPVFEEWMTQSSTPEALLARIRHQFVLGGHKAAAIAKMARKAHVLLVSPALADVPLTGMERQPSPSRALDVALALMGSGARISVLPRGASVLPQLPTGSQAGSSQDDGGHG